MSARGATFRDGRAGMRYVFVSQIMRIAQAHGEEFHRSINMLSAMAKPWVENDREFQAEIAARKADFDRRLQAIPDKPAREAAYARQAERLQFRYDEVAATVAALKRAGMLDSKETPHDESGALKEDDEAEGDELPDSGVPVL